MSTVVAAIRPSDWEFPLFVHVLGAILLMGTLFVAAAVLLAAWRKQEPGEVATLTRFGLWTIIVGVLPAYLIMRVGAEWIYDKENFGDDPDWIDIGYATADLGAILTLISIVLAIVGIRQLRAADRDRLWLGRIVGAIALLLLIGYAIAVWAMTGKPG